MKRSFLKRNIGYSIICGLVCIVILTGSINARYTSGEKTTDHLVENEAVDITIENIGDVIRLTYHINRYETEKINIQGVEYIKISIPGEANLEEKSAPDLPAVSRSIIIPDTARMNVRIIKAKYKDMENIMVAPSKGAITRNINPDSIPYEFNHLYNDDAFYPESIAVLNEPYILRDFRGQVVTLHPFSYNPVQHILRFYSKVVIEVYPDGSDNFNIIERDNPPLTLDTDFIPVYENHFINFPASLRYTPVEEQGNMLVITYNAFWSAMQPFVQWKNMKGVRTTIVNVTQIGSTATQIKNYIINYYNTHGLTFVLLVGDAAQIPTFTASGGASDPTYSYIVGSDHYPDLFVGRFSASTVAQVQTQVLRSIEYESTPQITATWYGKGSGIASSEGPGDNGEYDYQHIRNIRTRLLRYTYSLVDEFYDGSQGGADASGNPTATMIANALNEGRGIINYCGHGSATSWATSGFSNTNINALTNDNKLPFIWSVACQNGNFNNYDTCFAEAWLRASRNGEPTGAIAVFMSSVNQYWNPPMAAQDEFNNILTESYVNNKKNTFGGISFNGCMYMNDRYGSQGYDMTDTWHVFGDPSLQVRTRTPLPMNVIHESTINPGATSFEVLTPGLKGALCALSRGYTLLGYGYTDNNGYATINLFEPLTGTDDLKLVVTAYNRIPYNATITVNVATSPARPSGQVKGLSGLSIQYTYTTSSNTGNNLYFKFNWGDETESDWLGPYQSGETVEASHTWLYNGYYNITAVVKIGTDGAPSQPSDPLLVRMYRLGDTNADDMVTLADIDPFVEILTMTEETFHSMYPNRYYYTADCNLDGMVTLADVDPFVVLLVGGGR